MLFRGCCMRSLINGEVKKTLKDKNSFVELYSHVISNTQNNTNKIKNNPILKALFKTKTNNQNNNLNK